MHSSKSSSVSAKSFYLILCIKQKLQILGGCIYTSKISNTIDIFIIIGLICELHILRKGIYQFLNLTCYYVKQCVDFKSNLLDNEICVLH
jgi:hypothetical protein